MILLAAALAAAAYFFGPALKGWLSGGGAPAAVPERSIAVISAADDAVSANDYLTAGPVKVIDN